LIYEGVYFAPVNVHPMGEMDLFDGFDYQTPPGKDGLDFYIGTGRDGVNFDKSWIYARKPLVPRGPAGSFDKDGVFPPSQLLTHQDEHWIFYGGASERHYSRGRDMRIGLAKLRLDGFVCLKARDKAGVVVTKPFKLQGSRLLVNVDAAKGELLVEILDAEGRPVPGFSAREAKTYKAVNQLRLMPQWRAGRDLSAIKGKVIRLKFHLRNAKLYSFRVAAHGAAVKETIEVNGLPVTLDALPDGLVIPDGLGLLTTPKLSGKLIYEGKHFTDDPRATITPGGDYLLMFPAGAHYARKRTKCNEMLAFRSSDKGKTWTGPKVAFDIDYSQHGFVPLIPKDSKRIYAFGTQPIPDMRAGNENSPIGFRYSDDDGHTWSKVTLIRPVNDPGFKGMSCMRMCQTGSGAWLIGSHAADWSVKPLKTRQYVLRSEDRGATWTVAPRPRHNGWFLEKFNRMDEGRPISLGGSNVLLMCRTPEGHLWNAWSKDDGKTWSTPEATPLVHPDAPPMLFRLSDGKTLAAFHHNRHHDLNYTTLDSSKVEMMKDRQEIWVAFSKDDGKTWSEPRFVFANAMTKKLQNAWWTYNCSYIDMFVDEGVCNIFVPHRWSRQLHLQISEKELFKLPTKDELKKTLQK